MDPAQVDIEDSWGNLLEEEFRKPYFDKLTRYLRKAKENGAIIYPPGNKIFQAFNKCPVNDVKVVILGQDPYHGPGQAMGLSFSVPRNEKIPPSLKNIFKEIKSDIGFDPPLHGDLSSWAEQGVFLLNAMLTVEHKKAGSHRKIGWQKFTEAVIKKLSQERENLVFLLWGNFAKSKKEFIDTSKHLVLESVHPSPLAGKAFFGNNHFSKCNAYLLKNGHSAIDWSIPE